MDEYREILARVDAWYRSVKEQRPAQVPCDKGCRDCCVGLFDVTLADRDLLREGLAAVEEPVRRDIEARAAAVVEKLRAVEPGIGDTLDGWEADAIDDLCDAVGDVECPVLGPGGECRLYAWRPLTCRLSGVPVVDVTGETVFPDGCAKCLLKPKDTPRLDCGTLRRDERRLLKRRYRARAGVPVFIAQALTK